MFSDVLGELVDLTETDLTVRTVERLVRVPRAEVTHAKRVPDRRRPSATESLERIAAAGWPAPEQAHLGEWLLRAADGWTARGNSALPIGDPGRTLNDAVDAVEAWYRARALPPKITVPDPVGARLTAELTRRGWAPAPRTLVQTAALAEVAAAARPEVAVRLDTTPPDAWFAAVAGFKGTFPDAARHILTGVPLARYAGIYAEDGSPIAVARGVVADGSWLGVSLVTVDPVHRRQGLGRAIVGALARWAADAGASQAYLQVEERNTAAVAAYAPLGFSTHHAYVTWTAP
ncbi:GNAT family N-acetyltransferase [Planosporangium flavigriseum]|uniref:N-acetyltransferase n=1 Tax=Planosporangium flavigriseum TaxID=373681 RepID=A0A8J3LPY4_9ACTN|nr:N-acetyltransferase [Planosporangium flavigriseum]